MRRLTLCVVSAVATIVATGCGSAHSAPATAAVASPTEAAARVVWASASASGSASRLRAGRWSVPVPAGWERETVPGMPFHLVRLTSGDELLDVLWGRGDPTLRETVHHGLVNMRDALGSVRISAVRYDADPAGYSRARFTLTGIDPHTGAQVAQAVAVLQNARRSFLGISFQVPGPNPPAARLRASLRGLEP